MFGLFVKLLLSYLLGSISGSLLIGRLQGVDIRTQGSGNAGGTNALRTQGVWFALAVIIIDIGKGILAVAVISRIPIGGDTVSVLWVAAACGLATVIGHIWPIFFGFRGGKGAGTLVGVLLVLVPTVMLGMLLVWLLVLVLTGYVGLATVLATLMIPLIMLMLGVHMVPLVSFGVIIGLLMVWTHRSNIQRLLQGDENRFERVRIQSWWRS